MNYFVYSYYLSLFVQFLAFFIQFYGVFLYVTPELIPLKYALNIEVCVSIIEFMVYLWILNMALTTEQRLDRLEAAIKELHDILEKVFDRYWGEDSKVEEIVSDS